MLPIYFQLAALHSSPATLIDICCETEVNLDVSSVGEGDCVTSVVRRDGGKGQC